VFLIDTQHRAQDIWSAWQECDLAAFQAATREASTECRATSGRSLLDREHRELLEAVMEALEPTVDAKAPAGSPRTEAALLLLRHLAGVRTR
jgi:hypothetical protein